ncbi:N-acetyl-gamma-glutamyl-phosphate reductase [Gemmatirosa kalamazoonensis]|uniref:N-acetyl-gamma-glutamyl-phosphate reductase n=1 Tax=Gemmatirosa kalamazoonensis TaxID=861299 RepID=W0REW0_9BACT|nr:Asd/ArgC dimerization domain-containing protein [Gemmatirosa kalamazoonensis]AHG88865.1 N-acetyl-gamma-glutamyl-phosphate reductase [Gemmatirosa kalamazoonensis]
MHKIPVGVLGASGYAGRELCGLVAGHPQLSLRFASADSRRGETARVRAAGTGAPIDVTFVAPDDARLDEAALVFSALPHGASATWSARARAAGAKVVDLSSDLRPGHIKPEVLSALHAPRSTLAMSGGGASVERGTESVEVPYGLPELFRDDVRGADVVANPGCYPTSVLLGLAPLAERGLLPEGAVVSVAAASGVSGAGNSPKADMLFGEVTEDFRAYGAGNVHRHLPEMRATMERLGADVDLVFTPHLLPVHRGILATMTVPVTELPDDVAGLWRERYAGEPFVEIVDGNVSPALRDVTRRNVVRIAAMPLQGMRRPTLLVLSAIDNLVKGAAGQALQNANLMLGLDEAAGLPR